MTTTDAPDTAASASGVEVTKDEFFAAIGPLNVHPRHLGAHPYVSVFETPQRREVGRIVPRGASMSESRYYLNERAEQTAGKVNDEHS